MNASDTTSEEYLAPRRCLRTPISELFWSAAVLEEGVERHLVGDSSGAAICFEAANADVVRDYIETMWGPAKLWPDQNHYLRRRKVHELPEPQTKAKDRMPASDARQAIIERDGYRCRFCGLWVVPSEVRKLLNKLYPVEVPWGSRNSEQHAAFQALWLQYDHVVPASYGGDSSADNVVVTCASCNFAKWDYQLAELGLLDPRDRQPIPTRWIGLTNVLGKTA